MTAAAGEVIVPSRTTPGEVHRVLVGIDGNTSCSCPGGTNHGKCWAQEQVKKEQGMTTENDTTQALVPIRVTPPKSLVPSRDDLASIAELARSIMGARGQMFPKELDTPGKVYAVMAYGLDLGVRPMTALRSIYVVNGRPEPSAQLMLGIVMAAEPDATMEIVELTDELCTMRINRPSRDMRAEYTYTLADAKRAGLVKQNNPWALYPRDMLRHACVKRLCRAYAPDLIQGIDAIALTSDDELMGRRQIEVVAELDQQHVIDVPSGDTVDTETGEIVDAPAADARDEDPPAATLTAEEESALAPSPPAEPEPPAPSYDEVPPAGEAPRRAVAAEAAHCVHDRIVNEERMWAAAEKSGRDVQPCSCCEQPAKLGDALCRFCAIPAEAAPPAAEQAPLIAGQS
jgi:hypothetical protein